MVTNIEDKNSLNNEEREILINAVPNAKNSYKYRAAEGEGNQFYGMRHSPRYMVHIYTSIRCYWEDHILYFAKEEDLILRVWIEFSWRI